MSSDASDLQAFHQFLTDNLHRQLSPEQCLEKWRAEHPMSHELQESVSVVQQSLEGMEAGDTGKSARTLIEEARQKHGIAQDA